ncbi:MAG: hypothetical protein ACLT4C_05270 [Butyricicoccus sp.]
MRSYEFPYPEAEQQTVVSRFGGIDCRTHPTKVSLSRSPDMQNMICDQNDFLESAPDGAHRRSLTHPSTGYSPCRMVWAAPYMRVRSCIFGRRTAHRPSCADMNEAFSQSFTMKGVLYLMDGKTYRGAQKQQKHGLGSRFRIRHSLCRPRPSLRRRPAAAPATRP